MKNKKLLFGGLFAVVLLSIAATVQTFTSTTAVTNIGPDDGLVVYDRGHSGNVWSARRIHFTNFFKGTNTFILGDRTAFSSGSSGNSAIMTFWKNHSGGHGAIDFNGHVSFDTETLQLGSSGPFGNYIYLQYASSPTALLQQGFGHPLRGYAKKWVATGGGKIDEEWASPGFQPISVNNTDGSSLGGWVFWLETPYWAAGNSDFNTPNTAGVEGMRVTPAGLTLTTGAFIGDGSGLTDLPESYVVETSINGVGTRTTNANASTLSLNFSTPKMWEFYSAPTVATMTVFAYNTEPAAGEFKRGTLVIRAGYNARTVTVPAWANAGAWASGDTLEAHKMLVMELNCIGPGTSNIVVSSLVECNDPLTPADSDVASFISAASVTDATQIDAVYRLANELKAAGLWSKEHVIYPFVGGSSSSHSRNLKNSAANQITWAGTVTHNGNGAKGDGSSGYGDTGFIPSTGFASQDDCRMFAYIGADTAGTANGFLASSINVAGTHRITLTVLDGGADDAVLSVWNVSLASGGPERFSSCDANTGTVKGPVMTQRTASNSQEIWLRSCTVNTDTDASVGLPDYPLGLFARSWDGHDQFGNMQLSGFSLGTKLTSGEWTTYRAIWERFETRLGRNVP